MLADGAVRRRPRPPRPAVARVSASPPSSWSWCCCSRWACWRSSAAAAAAEGAGAGRDPGRGGGGRPGAVLADPGRPAGHGHVPRDGRRPRPARRAGRGPARRPAVQQLPGPGAVDARRRWRSGRLAGLTRRRAAPGLPQPLVGSRPSGSLGVALRLGDERVVPRLLRPRRQLGRDDARRTAPQHRRSTWRTPSATSCSRWSPAPRCCACSDRYAWRIRTRGGQPSRPASSRACASSAASRPRRTAPRLRAERPARRPCAPVVGDHRRDLARRRRAGLEARGRARRRDRAPPRGPSAEIATGRPIGVLAGRARGARR